MLDLTLEFLEAGKRWIQQMAYHDGRGNRCMVGALQYVRRRHGISGDGTRHYLLHVQAPHRIQSVSDYSELTCRDFEDVRAWIQAARRLAVADLEQRQPQQLAAYAGFTGCQFRTEITNPGRCEKQEVNQPLPRKASSAYRRREAPLCRLESEKLGAFRTKCRGVERSGLRRLRSKRAYTAFEPQHGLRFDPLFSQRPSEIERDLIVEQAVLKANPDLPAVIQ
jgi:hypothetical protein